MRRIILASGSPRRRQLMADMGIEFECVPSNFEERLDNTRPAEEVAKELALGKARDVAVNHPDALVVGSDTVVAFDGRQLGKQPDEQAARELLHQLSGQKNRSNHRSCVGVRRG